MMDTKIVQLDEYEQIRNQIIDLREQMNEITRPTILIEDCRCGLRAETELHYQGKNHHLCWKDAFVLISEINSKKATSKELFDRIPTDCYLCKAKDHELGNLNYTLKQLQTQTESMIPKKKHWWNRRR